jgi:AraC-like DNA-binding protein
MRVTRGPEQLRAAAPERVGLGLQLYAPATFTHCGADQVVGVGELGLTDGTSVSDYTWNGVGGVKVVVIDYTQLALPVDTVRAAATRLPASPLYGMAAAHIAALGEEGDIQPGPARIMVGSATIQLIRALITTAAEDTRRQRDDLHDSLYLRMTAYVEQRLGDPALNAEQVARAHHISVRQLYTVWSEQGTPIGQWIMTARLEGARAELARCGRSTPVGAVARRWGFVNAAHFARRFRAAYGMTPRDWQHMHDAR